MKNFYCIKRVGEGIKKVELKEGSYLDSNMMSNLSELVGGYIEIVNIGNGISMVVNEEGKMYEMAHNFVVSYHNDIECMDDIKGNVAFVKLHVYGDGEAGMLSLTDEDIEYINCVITEYALIPVFVYGSLKKGFHNHRLISHCRKYGNGCIKDFGLFSVYNGSFPGILPRKGSKVYGEVYLVDRRTLGRLNMLEGFRGDGSKNNMYNRDWIKCEVDGEKLCGYVYVWNSGRMNPFIESGKWIK